MTDDRATVCRDLAHAARLYNTSKPIGDVYRVVQPLHPIVKARPGAIQHHPDDIHRVAEQDGRRVAEYPGSFRAGGGGDVEVAEEAC